MSFTTSISLALASTMIASLGPSAPFSSLSVASATAHVPSSVTSGSINTNLPSSGVLSEAPFPTGCITRASAPLTPTTIANHTTVRTMAASSNIFVPIASGAPPPSIPARGGHPVPGIGISGGHTAPIETNKFYTNLMVGDQNCNVFTEPYSLRWIILQGLIGQWGFGISHVEKSQEVFGAGNPASYYINPLGLDSIILSANELQGGASLSTANHAAFSVSASLAPLGSSTPLLTLPLVQGMGLVTGIYNSATLLIQSGLYFKEISPVTSVGSSFRWTVFLNDGHTWAIYITPSAGGQAPALTLSSNGSAIQGPSNFNGLVQVAKLENQADDVIYDQSVGVYPSSGSVSATASGSYSLSWKKAGDTSKILMMFALPHHVQSFTSDTQRNVLNITLQTPTKGVATAVRADQWNLQEQLPTSMGFAPWSPTHQSVTSIPGAALPIISSALATELGEDMIAQTNIGSVYGSAKALAKFASLVYTANDLVGNKGLAGAALLQLEKAYGMWISNTAACTLVYDTVWGGVIDAGVWTDPNADYGNGMYNDHMFHYGYMVYAAAVIAHLDPSWLNQGVNKAWVNSLVRDFANSVDNDQYFPFSRNFDWYHGHSWASGLYASGDGNNIESTSEDTFASYGIKMWGQATDDSNMEARGNLMLAIQARALSNYFLMQSNNVVQPSNFIGNKADGILFENKVDHTTYFGTNIEYIEGIHMIPLGSHSGLTRPVEFVKEEWATYFDSGRVDAVAGAWRGILYANLAFIDPVSAWNFFSQPNFDMSLLDGGASLSWYLTLAATLGGVSGQQASGYNVSSAS